jgi:RimJ/RimL family protein N-acetyltransferase
MLGNPDVGSRLGSPSRESIEQTVARYERSWDVLGFGRFAVEDRQTAEFVGRVGLMHQAKWTASEDKIEIGWAITRERWGEGLATEAARAVLADGFDRVGLPRVIGFSAPDDIASVRVMERVGMTLQGTAQWAGTDHVWYAIRAEEWAEANRD